MRRSTSQRHGLQDCKGDKFVTFFSDHPRLEKDYKSEKRDTDHIFQIKKLWIDGYSFSSGSQNVISDAVNNLQNNEVNDIGNSGFNSNAIAIINNASNNVDGNENLYEAPIGMRLNHNLMAGVA